LGAERVKIGVALDAAKEASSVIALHPKAATSAT